MGVVWDSSEGVWLVRNFQRWRRDTGMQVLSLVKEESSHWTAQDKIVLHYTIECAKNVQIRLPLRLKFKFGLLKSQWADYLFIIQEVQKVCAKSVVSREVSMFSHHVFNFFNLFSTCLFRDGVKNQRRNKLNQFCLW